MHIYFLNISLIILYAYFFLYNNKYRNKKAFVILASLNWIILSGLRHLSIGADTYSYLFIFNSIRNKSWQETFVNFYEVLFLGASGRDPGYAIFEKSVQLFTTNYQIYLIIVAVIFTGALGIFIYRNSREPLISFLIYSCLFYSFFAITGYRQTIATALAVLIGHNFIQKRKIWHFSMFVLIAFTIHKSILVFFLFYFLADKSITGKYLAFMITLIVFMFFFRNQVMKLLGIFMGYESYIHQFEGAGTWVFTMMLAILIGVAIWRLKPMLKNNTQVTHYINALLLAFVFLPLTYVDPSAMRVVQYFSLFVLLLVPEMILSFQKHERLFVFYIATAVLLLLFIRNNPQYLFFWHGK